MDIQNPHHVVVVGGGFGGLYAAKSLGSAPVKVTLIDKRNFHLFQPLLYQVATGTISPADIASPLRGILRRTSNAQVLLDEVVSIEPETKTVVLNDDTLQYDSLIVATGVSHHYFGNDQWQDLAPGLKTVEDALEMRRRIFNAFEAAEKETDPEVIKALTTFVIVGGGPTGVELAGAIAELAYHVLPRDFQQVDTSQARILLIEGVDRVLPPYDPKLSANAEKELSRLGVTVKTGALVTNITPETVTVKFKDSVEEIPSRTVLWAAGVKASGMGKILADRTGASLDRSGRVMVESDLSIPGYPNIFVIGDLAYFNHQGVDAASPQDNRPLPGIAPVAMQEGEYVARLIRKRLKHQGSTPFQTKPFQYVDRGSLAIIGKNAAVVDLGYIQLTGIIAWLIWIFAHIFYLIEFDNKLIVMTQWGWNYFTQNRGARLITGENSLTKNPTKVNELM
ncbi:MAG: NAD(P)/FAD-dependent oxidoreductase [Cyanobacteria bacterium P01_F01_bin.150]